MLYRSYLLNKASCGLMKSPLLRFAVFSYVAVIARAFEPGPRFGKVVPRLPPAPTRASHSKILPDQRTLAPPSRLWLSADTAKGKEPTQAGGRKLDTDAIFKYTAAIAIQLSLIFGVFTGLDKLVSAFNVKVPFAANFFLFYVWALRTRIFNPLKNNRPQIKTLESAAANDTRKRKMPTWTPPGFVFPIVWLLIIAPIRAITSAMVYGATGKYANVAIMSLMLHLSIGDVWNTINNIEKRFGVSVIGVYCVWLSKAHAAYRYYQVVPFAGKLLSVTLVWLTIASTLITRVWQLNPDPKTGKPEPLYPVAGSKKTEFAWFVDKKK